MRLRTRITIIFVLLTALLQLGVFAFIFLFSRYYTQQEFDARLREEIRTTAEAYAISGGQTPDRQLTLPEEQTGFFPIPAGSYPADLKPEPDLPDGFYSDLQLSGEAGFEIGGRYYRGLIQRMAGGEVLVLMSARDTYGLAKQKNLLNLLILAFALSLVFLLLLGQYFATQALSPMGRIIRQVRSIKARNLHKRVEVGRGGDELAELAVTFNNMLDRLEIAFDQQSRFINNASHELRNPLTAILGLTEVGQIRERDRKAYQKLLGDIQREAQRLDQLVDGLLRLGQTGYSGKGMSAETFRLDEAILEIREELDQPASHDRIQLDFSQLPENEQDITLSGNPTLMKVALGNILDNACKYSGEAVRLKMLTEGNDILVLVRDQGIGIPPGELRTVFEPFNRGSNARNIRGYGFGLPLAYRIVRLHHGDIRITSQPGKGTLVTVRVPNLEGQRGLEEAF